MRRETLGLALLRARVVPFWAAAGIMAWPTLHVIGLVAGTEWFEVAGALAQAAGLAVTGTRLLSLSNDPQVAVGTGR